MVTAEQDAQASLLLQTEVDTQQKLATKILNQRMHSTFSVVSYITWTNHLSYRGGRKEAWSEADQRVYLVQCPHFIKF